MIKQTKRINVSFKHNERDQRLYQYVQSKNDKSNFIKDCIEFYLNNNSFNKTITNNIWQYALIVNKYLLLF